MRPWFIFSAGLALCVSGFGQKGTAPDGYYPVDYSGDTYTGTVVASTERTITLQYTTKKKTETFTGVTTEPCTLSVNKTPTPVRLTTIPKGSVMTVLYEAKKTKGEADAPEKLNVIIGFWIKELNGKKSDNPPIVYCFVGMAKYTAH